MTEKIITWKIINGKEWCVDEKNNKNSVERWGSKEAAEKALRSLGNCSDCSDCSYCSDCRGCSNKKGDETNKVIIPKIENIHQKVFEAASKENALDMAKWHTCETTHCRAGWVVFLAGEEGKKLEVRFDTPLAASMIYRESSPIKVRMNDFFDRNQEAMEKMRKAAEEEIELTKRNQ